MKVARRLYRLLALMIHVVVGLTLSLIALRGVEAKPPAPRQRRLIEWWLRRATRILGLEVHTRGSFPEPPVFAVANHISWLDIPALASVTPVCFVSKVEIRHWPLFGWLVAKAGTLFIERGGKNAANQVAEQITWYLRRGQSVLVFPEGTTTGGRGVRRFHPRLFGAALHVDAPVQPIALCYPHPQGVNPMVPLVGGSPFLIHALRVLGERRIEVEVNFCTPLTTKRANRRALAEQTQAEIEAIVTHRAAPKTAERPGAP
jgi:1-acyl-sn-glycerol-3-phosphate acyltransferase